MRRGFALVTSLLMISLLFVMGIGFLGKRAAQYRGVRQSLLAAQARAIAWAGLEHARTKLEKDINFPPNAGSEEQGSFSYSEQVLHPDGSLAGSYTVTLDLTYVKEPYYRLLITSTGRAGGDSWLLPAARRTVKAEMDVFPGVPVPGNRYPNPTYFQFRGFSDEGSF